MIEVYDAKDVKMFIGGEEIPIVGEVKISTDPSLAGKNAYSLPRFSDVRFTIQLPEVGELLKFKGTIVEGE